jgi:hypothetical protein
MALLLRELVFAALNLSSISARTPGTTQRTWANHEKGETYEACVVALLAMEGVRQKNRIDGRMVRRQWLLVAAINIPTARVKKPHGYRSISKGDSHQMPTPLDNSAAELINCHLWPLKSGYYRQGRCAALISLIIIIFLLAYFQSAVLNRPLPL